MAKVVYFYGFSHKEVMDMEIGVFDMYCEAIQIIEAQNLLIQFTANDWPNMKKQDREQKHRKLHQMAFPIAWDNSDEISGEQMASMLKGLIGG